jgi:hypothetical protein
VGSPPALPSVRSLPTGRVPPELLLTFGVSAPARARSAPYRLSWDSLTGRPAADILSYVHSQSCRNSSFGPPTPIGESRSALVVSHHHSGFLRTRARTSCDALPAGVCDVSPDAAHKCRRTYLTFPFLLPIAHTPPEEFPSSTAVPHHCGRSPLVVTVRDPPGASSSILSSGTPSQLRSRALTLPTRVGPAITLDRHRAALAFYVSSKWVNHFPNELRHPPRHPVLKPSRTLHTSAKHSTNTRDSRLQGLTPSTSP